VYESGIGRRKFITLLGGVAVGWPLSARAQQQAERMRLMLSDNREGRDCVRAFQQALQKLGWNEGRNVRTEIRWGQNNVDLEHRYVTELMELMPDVILAAGNLSAVSLQHIRPTFPVVFVQVGIQSARA
jgi:putative ABC transport system substrate-binding protein